MNGQSKWVYYLPDESEFAFHGNPLVIAEHVIFGTDATWTGQSGALYSVETASGKLHWRKSLPPGVASDLFMADSLIIAVSLADTLYALIPTDGSTKWLLATKWQYSHAIRLPLVVSPLFGSESIIFPSRDSSLYLIEPSTGRVINSYRRGCDPSMQSVLIEGELVVGGSDSLLCVLSLDSLKPVRSVWNNNPHSRSAITDDSLLVYYLTTELGSATSLVCRRRANLSKVWQIYPPGAPKDPFFSSNRLCRKDDMVIVGTMDSLILGIEMSTGREIWRRVTDGPVMSVTVTDTLLLAGTFTGSLTAFRLPR